MTQSSLVSIVLTVNGIDYPVTVDQSRNLLSVIRTEIGLTGTKEGCDDCECGACMVLLDGRPVNSCSYLAVQAEGRAITTVEGLADGQALQRATGATCSTRAGCSAASARPACSSPPRPCLPYTRAHRGRVRIGLSGNLCRCTGYTKIVAAVMLTATEP